MNRMGGDKMGMSDSEMMHIVKIWRNANPAIVNLWSEIQRCAHEAVKYRREIIGTPRNLKFNCNGDYLTITLPSGRSLYYYHPVFKQKMVGRRMSNLLYYEGLNQETKTWGQIDTYGGKLTENIVQAISRDLLGYAMINLEANGYGITMHVHDEAIAEVPDDGRAEEHLDKMIKIMRHTPNWAADLPLNAAGFTSKYYQKD
jgi:DNA polymerase